MIKWIKSVIFVISDDRNLGYLLFRVFLGGAMLTHGIPKLLGGPQMWAGLGGVMTKFGAPGPAVFWGFMATMAESAAALLIALGGFTTIASFLLVVNMSVAAFVVHGGDAFARRELALFYLFGALMFMLKGAGRYSLDNAIGRWKK